MFRTIPIHSGKSAAGAWTAPVLLAITLACAGASSVAASDKGNGSASAPTPASTQAQEAALRQRMEMDEQDALAREGIDAIANERDALIALGQSPDDPIALAAYRAEMASPNNPDAITAAGDFFLDTAWGSGGLAPDRYAGANSGTYRGIKAAKLDNGDLVVVGEVQFTPGGTKQLGITKRGANGARKVWSGAGQYGAFSNQYLLWPNTDTSVPRPYSVHDVKVHDNRIYALITGHLLSPDIYAPNVICFNADGSGCGWWFAYVNATGTNDAVAMDIYGSRLVVLGRHSLGDTGNFWTAKWTVAANGGLSNLVNTDFTTPAPYFDNRTEPADIAFRRSGGIGVAPANPGYYILFTHKYNTDAASRDYDPCLLAVKPDNTWDATFPDSSNSGGRCKPFDDNSSALTDRAIALTSNTWGGLGFPPAPTGEGVQVLVSVARKYESGIGVWELFDRADHPRFGAVGGPAGADARGGGRMVFGGCGTTNGSNSVGEGCSVIFGNSSHVPMDLDNVGGDVGVVGYRNAKAIAGTTRIDSPLFARMNGDSGKLNQYTTFSSGYSQGRFNAIGVRDATHVVGIGEAIDSTITTTTARTQIQTGLTSDNDSIFKNGFD